MPIFQPRCLTPDPMLISAIKRHRADCRRPTHIVRFHVKHAEYSALITVFLYTIAAIPELEIFLVIFAFCDSLVLQNAEITRKIAKCGNIMENSKFMVTCTCCEDATEIDII